MCGSYTLVGDACVCLQRYLRRRTFLASYKRGSQKQLSRAEEMGAHANSRGKGLSPAGSAWNDCSEEGLTGILRRG